MGIELESYADQLRDEWMPGHILIHKHLPHMPEPMRSKELDKELAEILQLEDAGILPLDSVALKDRNARAAAVKRYNEKRKLKRREDERQIELGN